MLKTYIQYLLPQRLITSCAGYLAKSRQDWLKNILIRRFIQRYQVDLSPAVQTDPLAYPSFSDFFTRRLKPELRPIAAGNDTLACPVDGCISQIGSIRQNQLLQAKNYYFDLETLLGNDINIAQTFCNGSYATFYLGPRDYHRVHMPLSGRLQKTIFVPGKLFSVNRMAADLIPGLYSRNERLVCLFDTDAGPMAVILVGAMIVGSIETVWTGHPVRAAKLTESIPARSVQIDKGGELGQFNLGSTVILLFAPNQIKWAQNLGANDTVQFGQFLGKINK